MPIFPRIRNLFRSDRLNDEVRQELETHIALIEEEEQARGADGATAHRRARERFGNATLCRERTRDADVVVWLDTARRDFLYSLRVLRKSPAFTLFAVLAMALGIGSTTLIFSALNSLILRQPYPGADRMYMVWQRLPKEDRVALSTKEFLEWQRASSVFEKRAVFTGNGYTLTGHGDPKVLIGEVVTPSLFEILGVHAALGRTFLPSEATPGHEQEVMLGYQLWAGEFGGRADVVGQPLTLNGKPYTVVGVMPKGFDFPDTQHKLWVPAALEGGLFQKFPDAHFLRFLGLLKPGVTPAEIQAEMAVLGHRLDSTDTAVNRHYYAIPLADALNGELRRPLVVLLFAVGFLLLIACANIANLMLARATARQREIAVRVALGAGRGRVAAQWLMESLVLAMGGGALGIVLAVWGLAVLRAWAAPVVPQLVHASVDGWVLGGACLLAAAAGVLAGLAPALSAARNDPHDSLKEGGRSTRSAAAARVQSALVFAEVSLAALLLVGCGLMLRSFIGLMHVNPGFHAEGVVDAEISLTEQSYPKAPEVRKFYHAAMEGMKSLPGVESVGMTTHLPFAGNSWGNSFDVKGQPAPPGHGYIAQIRPCSPGYLATVDIPLLEGRDFGETDTDEGPGVAIVNDLLAKRHWPPGQAIGKQISYNAAWLTIVGVCGNIRFNSLDSTTDPEIYVPYPQLPEGIVGFVGRDNHYVVRTESPAAVEPAMRAVLHSLDPRMAVNINRMGTLIDQSLAQPRFRTWLITSFSLLALVLACLGVYSVISYLVGQRSNEFGIRLALGALRADIVRDVLLRSARPAAAGIVCGLTAAYFLTRFLGSLLFGVTDHDPASYLGAALVLAVVALLAGYFPARRAARTDPLAALRCE